MTRRSLLVGTGGAAGLLAAEVSVGAAPPAAASRRGDAAVVLAWNQLLLRLLRTPGTHPGTVHPTRSFALLHAAMFNAVVAVTRSSSPYLFRVNADRDASPVAAAAAAAHGVLRALYPAKATDLDTQLAADLATVRDSRASQTGVRAGALTAKLLLGLRADDGSAAIPQPIEPGTAPGAYRPAPPAFAPAAFTHWPAVAPFVLRRPDQFRPDPYPDLGTARYARATNEVKLLGQDTSQARTVDQTTQARFWAGPIQNYWNEIAQAVVSARKADLDEASKVFAALNLALADTAIAFYEAKYHYRVWRPITAIRLADDDGNPATSADATWLSLANTPADPTYPGAHSAMSQAAAVILRDAFGPAQRITVTSEVLAGVTREFGRFQDVVAEAGASRVYAGVHTGIDHDGGVQLGNGVANFVLDWS